MNSRINFTLEIDQTTTRIVVAVVALLALLALSSSNAGAQEAAETIRVNTRVVFMDAPGKDKRSGVPIADLKPENFEVFDDGTARQISYFTREGQARQPLALVLILDLRDSGAGRYLKRPEVLKVVADELAKLSPQDEVAILAINFSGEDEKRVWLSGFTREPAKLVAALARAPLFVDSDHENANARKGNQKSDADRNSSLPLGSESTSGQQEARADSSGPGPGTPRSDEVGEIEVIKGKKGSVVTRTTRPDGSVDVKRVSKSGEVTMELGNIYDLAAAVKDTTRKAGKTRKLEVRSRKGYYMSETAARETKATAPTETTSAKRR